MFHLFVFTICIVLLFYRTSEWLQAYHLLNDHKVNRLSDYFLHYSNFNEGNMISDHTTLTTNISNNTNNNNNNENNKNAIHQYKYVRKTNTSGMKDKQNATIILCNINPIRLSALLSLRNGSEIYTYLINKYGKIDIFNLLNETKLTKDQIKNMSHSISSMLKSCQYGDVQCSINDFAPIFTMHGWCYKIYLNYSRSIELKLILDPQEYDYIIPNKGYTGFYLIVQSANCQSDNEEMDSDNSINDQSVIVGPKFHSFINIKQQYPFERRMDRYGPTTKDSCSTFHIQSVVQLEKLPIQVHSLQKFNINMFRRNGTVVHLGVLYQQKAFLQIYNYTAYNLIKDLSKELYMARRLAQFASECVWKMYKHLEHFSRQSNQMKPAHNQNTVNCYRQVYHLLTSAGKDLLSSKNALFITSDDEDQNGGNNQTLDSIELHLINSFFETKVIVSPSSTLLRKILTVMMKFRYLLSDLSGTPPIYQRNTSFLLSSSSASPSPTSTASLDSISEASQLDTTTTTTTHNCSHLIMYHEVQIDKSGEAASAALARLDHVNNELHNLIRDNHLARLIFPRSSYPYTELSTSSMVSVTVQITRGEISQLYQTSTFYADIYLKNLLLTIFISTLSLYLALFILVELCTIKQNALTNHISVQCCRLTNQKRGRPHHHHHQHPQNDNHRINHDSCIRLTTDQYNQITSLDVSHPNNYRTCSNHECHKCNNYDDDERRKYGNYYFKCGEYEEDNDADNRQIINTPFKQYTNYKHGYNSSGLHNYLLDKSFSAHQNKAATLHTSSIMYKCKDYCQTKAYLDGSCCTVDRNVSIFPGHGQKTLVEHLETPNDLKMPTGFLLTPEEITPIPYSTSSPIIFSSSSKPPYFHSSLNFQWNTKN